MTQMCDGELSFPPGPHLDAFLVRADTHVYSAWLWKTIQSALTLISTVLGREKQCSQEEVYMVVSQCVIMCAHKKRKYDTTN